MKYFKQQGFSPDETVLHIDNVDYDDISVGIFYFEAIQLIGLKAREGRAVDIFGYGTENGTAGSHIGDADAGSAPFREGRPGYQGQSVMEHSCGNITTACFDDFRFDRLSMGNGSKCVQTGKCNKHRNYKLSFFHVM